MKPSELKRIVNKEFNIDTLRAFQEVIEDRVYFIEKAMDLGTRPQIKGFMSHMKNFKEALRQLKEEKPGLWANIRAKRARGEKPAHKNSNAHKDAVKAGKKINAMSEDKTDALRWFGNLKYFYQKAFAELKGEDRETYKQLAKEFFSKLEIDQKVRPIGLDEQEGKSLADLEIGEKFTFNGSEYTFIELYPELPNAARVVLPNGRKTVVSFGGGKVNTGKKADIGPDAFGQGKGHHID